MLNLQFINNPQSGCIQRNINKLNAYFHRIILILILFSGCVFLFGCGNGFKVLLDKPYPEKDITGFTILGVSGTIGANSISLTVPYGTDVTSLTPTVTITGASVSPGSGVSQNFTNPVTYTVTASDGSTKAYTVTVNVALNSAKDITGFSILGVSGTIGANSITLTVPYGTNVTSLTPAVTITGASVSPGSGVSQDFTNPVTYTVTASDSSTKAYTVTVNVALNSAKDITGFSILGVSGTIGANSITLTVPYGTNVTSLTPTVTITGASVSPGSGVSQNFTNPVTYTVTASDGSTKAYTVTVNVALNSAKDITGFSILGVSGTIGANSITLTVPYGTNVTSLTPTVTITGASVSPGSGVSQDFTNPVTYTVTASDGSTKAYTVTVNVALNSAKDITGFSILGVSGTIGANSITLTVPYGTNVTSLTPTVTITGASVSPGSGVSQDFTNPVTYTVTASDSSTKAYTVTVNVATAGTIYWTETGGAIKNIHDDATGEVTLLTVTGIPLDIALDVSGEKMYWTEYSGTSFQIKRAEIDGSNSEGFSSAYSSSTYFGPTSIAIDSGTSKIYWTQFEYSNTILYSSLTTFVEHTVKSGISPNYTHSICLDTVSKNIYLTTDSYWNLSFTAGSGQSGVACYYDQTGSLFYSPINLNGLSSTSMALRGIAADGTGGHVYYVGNNGTYLCILRSTDMTINPGTPAVWINSEGSFGIQQIALDLTNRKIYWLSDTNYRIYRADLDTANSNIEIFLQLSSKPAGIAIAQ